MAKERSLVRASDIGAWTFCHRAWWLAQVKGVPHQNPQRLKWGETTHETHGRQVVRSQQLRWWGMVLCGAGLLAAGILLLFLVFTGI